MVASQTQTPNQGPVVTYSRIDRQLSGQVRIMHSLSMFGIREVNGKGPNCH